MATSYYYIEKLTSPPLQCASADRAVHVSGFLPSFLPSFLMQLTPTFASCFSRRRRVAQASPAGRLDPRIMKQCPASLDRRKSFFARCAFLYLRIYNRVLFSFRFASSSLSYTVARYGAGYPLILQPSLAALPSPSVKPASLSRSTFLITRVVLLRVLYNYYYFSCPLPPPRRTFFFCSAARSMTVTLGRAPRSNCRPADRKNVGHPSRSRKKANHRVDFLREATTCVM